MENYIDIALKLLKYEASGDVKNAADKMDLDNYSMTWMYKSKDTLFPSVSGKAVRAAMDEVYEIQGRKYEILNTAQHENVVFVEMIESYPSEEAGKEYRTPVTLVLEFKDGKVVRGRHYCDPQLSYEYLEAETIYKATGHKPKLIIEGE